MNINNHKEEKKQISDDFNQDVLLQINQYIKKIEQDYIQQGDKMKSKISDLQEFMHQNFQQGSGLIQNFQQGSDLIQNEKNVQLKEKAKEQKLKKSIQEEIEFFYENIQTRILECLEQQQQYVKQKTIDIQVQEIEQLKKSMLNLQSHMKLMENKITEISSNHQKYQDFEKEINYKLQQLNVNLQQNFESKINIQEKQINQIQEQIQSKNTDLSSLKEIQSHQKEIYERLQKLQRQNEEKSQQINKQLSEQHNQFQLQIQDTISNKLQDFTSQQQNKENSIQCHYQQQLRDISNKLQELEKEINSIKPQTNNIKNVDQKQLENNYQNKPFNPLQQVQNQNSSPLNFTIQNKQPKLNQTIQINPTQQQQQNQQCTLGFNTLQNQNAQINPTQYQQQNQQCTLGFNTLQNQNAQINPIQQQQQNQQCTMGFNTLQNQNAKINPIQQQQQNQQIPFGANTQQNQNINKLNFPNQAQQNHQTLQISDSQLQIKQNFDQKIIQNQGAQFTQPQIGVLNIQKQSQLIIKNDSNQNQPIQQQSQIKISTKQNQAGNEQFQNVQQLQQIQKDCKRSQQSQDYIYQIYNKTTRLRSAQGNYQYFIREVEDYHQVCKNYGIKNIVQKQKLKEICNALREVRGDGNCFYTAFGFQVIQILIGDYSIQEFNNFINKLEGKFKCQIQVQNNIICGEEFHNTIYNEFLFRLQQFRSIDNKEDRIHQFIQHFQAYDEIPNEIIDGCLYGLSTIFFRNLSYYLVETSDQKHLIDDQSTLLKWETECNSNEIVISLLANYFDIKIQLLFFENGDFQLREYNQNSKSSIILLIQPGHYNIGLKYP